MMEEQTSCAVGGCPITCEYMRYPQGTEPFGCVYPRRCEYQRPLRPDKPPSPPTEMPEVEPSPPFVGEAPMVLGKCLLWYREDTGGKKPRTCDGCKIAGCAVKGRINPKVDPQPPPSQPKTLICYDRGCMEQNSRGGNICMREEGPCEKQRTE